MGIEAGGRQGLVYHAGGLGDFVLSVPAILRVAQAHPHVEWSVWGTRDRVCLLPGFQGPPSTLLREGHTLWKAPSPSVRELFRGLGVVLRFGGRRTPEWKIRTSGSFLPVTSFSPSGGPRVPVFHRDQLDALGVPPVREPWLPRWRAAVLSNQVPREILIHPGSGGAAKNVPPEVWGAVVKRLREETGSPVRALVGPVEQERGGLDGLLPGVDAVERSDSLPKLLTVLSTARLFLGNDSGVSHLAGILGLPTVVAFGPSDPRIWRPLGPRVQVVASTLGCAPCTTGGPVACEVPACLGDVREPQLLAAARRALSLPAPPGP